MDPSISYAGVDLHRPIMTLEEIAKKIGPFNSCYNGIYRSHDAETSPTLKRSNPESVKIFCHLMTKLDIVFQVLNNNGIRSKHAVPLSLVLTGEYYDVWYDINDYQGYWHFLTYGNNMCFGLFLDARRHGKKLITMIENITNVIGYIDIQKLNDKEVQYLRMYYNPNKHPPIQSLFDLAKKTASEHNPDELTETLKYIS